MDNIQELSRGELISSQYEIRELLGRGGFGVVYSAHDRKLDREVAIKMLLSDSGPFSDDFVQRFYREIKLARQLEHPNIVRLYDYGDQNGSPFMVMEFVRGQELADVLGEEGGMDHPRIKNILQQLLDGLNSAHELNIVHRDLKPQNIMLTRVGMRSDIVKVLDFGIAKAVGDAERASKDTFQTKNQMVGTPSYAAPEQLRQESIGAFTDIYAAGLIIIEMLTGQALLEGTLLEVVAAHIDPRPHNFPEWVKTTPFGPIIEKAIQKDPRDRYQNAREMYQAVEALAVEAGTGIGVTGAMTAATSLNTGNMGGTPSTGEMAGPTTGDLGQLPERSNTPLIAVIVLLLLATGVGVYVLLSSLSGEDSTSDTAQAEQPPTETAGTAQAPDVTSPPPETAPPTMAAVTPPETTAPAHNTDVQGGSARPETPPTQDVGSAANTSPEVETVEGSPKKEEEEPKKEEEEPKKEEKKEKRVKITFESKPTGAKVKIDGDVVCKTPCSHRLKKGEEHVIEISKRGYRPKRKTHAFSSNKTLEVRLFRGL